MSSSYVNEYIQSTEEYKGFVLEIRCYRFYSSKSLAYHRDCILYKDGVAIARAKTKKELKDLIDHGCFFFFFLILLLPLLVLEQINRKGQ